MKSTVLMGIWPWISLTLLILAILLLVRHLKRNGGLLLLIAISLIGFSSCNKERSPVVGPTLFIPPSESVKSFGFDLEKEMVIIGGNHPTAIAVSFNSIEEARAYFKPIIEHLRRTKSSSAARQEPIQPEVTPGLEGMLEDPIGGSGHMAVMTDMFMLSGYSVVFNWTQNADGSLSASGFTSNVVGITWGESWEQTGSSWQSYPNSTLIYFTVTGQATYSVILKGVGTVFTLPVVAKGVYDTRRHEYVINSHSGY